MQQNSAPSDDNAHNNPQDDPLPPTVDSGEGSGESNTDSKHDHAIKESVNTSIESTRGDGEADASASAAPSENQGLTGQSTASERQARMIEQMTARRDREPRQRSIPRFRGGGGSPRSPVARSKDFIRRLFDRKKSKPLGTPYSSLPAKTPPSRSDSGLPSDGKMSSQGSPSLLDDRKSVEHSVSPCHRAGQSEVDRRRKVRSHRGVASENRGMTGGSPRVKSSEDAASAPEKTQVYEPTQGPNSGIPQGDGNREYTGEQTENQQHAPHSHAMTAAPPPTLDAPKITGQIDTKDAHRTHEQRPRVQPVHQQNFINGPSKSTQISRHVSLPDIQRQRDQSSAHGNISSVRPQLTLNTQLETKRDSELESATQTTSRITSSSGISWSSSTTLCSAAPSRSSSKEADDISNYSESDQSSASSAQQQENKPLQQITNDTGTAAAIPPRLTAVTKADKPGTAATGRFDRCSGLLESICRSGDGTVETCLNSSNNPAPPPPPPSLPGGASSNIVVGVKTTTSPTPATAAATQATPDATNAKDATFMVALMRGGGHGPRLDLDSFAPSEPLPAPQTSRRHSAILSPSAPILEPVNATNASQISSFGSPTFVGGCGGGHENPGVSVSPAPCEDTGKSSVVGENDEDDGDGSIMDVDHMCPDVALASSCGSSSGTVVAAAVAVEVTSFPSALLRRVDVVRPTVHADTFAPLLTTVAANRDVDIDMHVPSRTSSLPPGSPLAPAPKSPVQEATEPAPPAATEKEDRAEKQANASTPSQLSPPRLSLDQPIRSPKRQAKPWWETGSGSADNEVATGIEGQAREPGKEEGGSDGPAFCGAGTGRGVWGGDGATGSTAMGKVEMEMEMPARRRKRDRRRERADRCSTGSWISME
ncbi:hypothetical protein IWX90DRAFT_488263 [Phyllosticta citrichinensis]|uniref:Uncharacterized protein n=1 Tax=Phyllosticta citrichinensis TaxID=1130410 RepID=A0ABR1XNF8_9PEZI